MRYLAVVCNADAMHSSQRIMQTTNSRDNHQTSEWKGERDTRYINRNKLFRRYTRGERLKANFTRPSIIDFQGMPGILLQDSHQREKQHVRHVMLTSHEICIMLNERAKFPRRDVSCTKEVFTTELKFRKYASYKF